MPPPSDLKLWVTRTEPGASATAARLVALGHRPLVAPLLTIESLTAAVDLEGVSTLAFTSANAVMAFARLEPRRDLPAFCVGEATADMARRAGFFVAGAADGGVGELASLIVTLLPEGVLLHPAAETRAGDLARMLARYGVAVKTLPIYRTVLASVLPEPVSIALAESALDGLLVHSPRAARVAAKLLPGAEPRDPPLKLFALSRPCAAPLAGFGLKVRIARQPREAALLALLSAVEKE